MNEQSKRELPIATQDMICQLRRSRKIFGKFIKWEDDNIPNTFPEEFKKRIKPSIYKDSVTIKVKELFEQRPMWSRYALLLLTKCRYSKLKYINPLFAFCYLNGPFRNLWIRYGYNPKLEKSSKIYQLIDCRYRNNHSATLHNKVTLFKDHSVSFKADNISAFNYLNESRAGIDAEMFEQNEDESLNKTDYIFRPGHLSIFKRTNYQLCDIEIPEVQKIIHENDGQETQCTEKDGWCVEGAIDRIRKLMLSEVCSKTISRFLNSSNVFILIG